MMRQSRRESIRKKIMRPPLIALAVCAALFAAAPAHGASQQDHDDCNSADVERNITGCAGVADDETESLKVRAIARVGRALALDRKGDLDGAMADFNDAIRLNPDDSLALSDRGVLWREKGDIDRAIADFTAAIARNPLPRSTVGGRGHVNVYANRGLAYWAKGDIEHALTDFDAAVGRDPQDTEARYHRAQIRVARRDLAGAVGDLDEVIRSDPKLADAYYLRGVSHYDLYMSVSPWIDPRDLSGAIADFSEVIKLAPDNASAFYARGLADSVNGDNERAAADFARAVEINPFHKDALAALKALRPDYQPAKNPVADWLDKSDAAKK